MPSVCAEVSYEGQLLYLSGDDNDPITKYHLENHVFYELDLLKEVVGLIALWGEGTLIDCGANIGNHTVFLSKAFQEREVISIEVNPESFAYLTRNIEKNELANVKAYNIGAGSEEKQYRLNKNESNKLGGVFLTEDVNGGLNVFPLDNILCEVKDISFIKIDVEGMELDCLMGARNTIKDKKPILSLEIKDIESLHKIEDYLEEFDYLPIGAFCDDPTIIYAPKEFYDSLTRDYMNKINRLMVHRVVDNYKWVRRLLKSNKELKDCYAKISEYQDAQL